eukprot:1136322-Pelagomonas_calceolata.AAC.2
MGKIGLEALCNRPVRCLWMSCYPGHPRQLKSIMSFCLQHDAFKLVSASCRCMQILIFLIEDEGTPESYLPVPLGSIDFWLKNSTD